MSEIRYTEVPPREAVLRALQRGSHAGGGLDASLRVLAEGLLGAESRIDLVTCDARGQVVLVLIGEEGQDRALLTTALAQRAWVEPRVADWLKLAPSLGARPDVPVRLSLLSPSYHPDTLAAAASLGPEVVELATYRCVRGGEGEQVLVEGVLGRGSAPESDGSGGAARFRTGLSEEDLDLTAQEIRDLT